MSVRERAEKWAAGPQEGQRVGYRHPTYQTVVQAHIEGQLEDLDLLIWLRDRVETMDEGSLYCLCCNTRKPHKSDCKLAARIRELEEAKGEK